MATEISKKLAAYPDHRMRAAEYICILLNALSSGRRTRVQLASELGVSLRTLRRYMQVISLYFPVTEEGQKCGRGMIRYYWLLRE